jgi:hypothetical protein
MRHLYTGIHSIPAAPLFLEGSDCLISSTVAVSRMANLPPVHLESDVLDYMTGLQAGCVDTLAIPPEAAWAERRLVQHVARTYLLGNQDELSDDDFQAQLAWCNGAQFHENACFNSVLAVAMLSGAPRELVLPHLAARVALVPGTVVLLDSAQPFAVLHPGATTFEPSDYAAEDDRTVLCVLDLARDIPGLQLLMQFQEEIAAPPPSALALTDTMRVHAETGQWLDPAKPAISA